MKKIRCSMIILNLFFIIILVSGCCCCSDKIFSLDANTPDANSPSVTLRKLKAILVICDDYNNPESNKIKDGIQRDYHIITRLLDRLEKRKILSVERKVLRGKNATTTNMTKEIKNLSVSSDDILFFYYSGHGGMTGGKTYLWPCDERELFRSRIQSLINSKDARFKMIITDACSSSTDSVGYKKLLLYMGNVVNEEVNDETYKNLFLNYQGLLDVTAATEGQYAWYDTEGGYFTTSLFKEILLQRPLSNWEDVISSAKEKTEDKFKEMYDMDLFDEDMKKDMDEKGITNQTPEAYTIPSLITNDNGSNSTPTPVRNLQNQTKMQVIIKNGSGYVVTYYIDKNMNKHNWSKNNCQKAQLLPDGSTTLSGDKTIRIFYDKKNNKTDYYELDRGNYYFGVDDGGLLQLYIGNPPDKTSRKGIPIYNFNHNTIGFKIEYTDGSTQEYTLKSNEYIKLDTDESVNIHFNTLSYKLDSGSTYYFSPDQYNKTDLYVSE